MDHHNCVLVASRFASRSPSAPGDFRGVDLQLRVVRFTSGRRKTKRKRLRQREGERERESKNSERVQEREREREKERKRERKKERKKEKKKERKKERAREKERKSEREEERKSGREETSHTLQQHPAPTICASTLRWHQHAVTPVDSAHYSILRGSTFTTRSASFDLPLSLVKSLEPTWGALTLRHPAEILRSVPTSLGLLLFLSF